MERTLTAAEISAYLEQHPDVGVEVARTARLAGPWEGEWRYVYGGPWRHHLAWACPAYQDSKDIGERKPHRWSWGVSLPAAVPGTSNVLGHGECDTREQARAAADALLRERSYGLAE